MAVVLSSVGFVVVSAMADLMTTWATSLHMACIACAMLSPLIESLHSSSCILLRSCRQKAAIWAQEAPGSPS
jgi:glutamate racemase